MKLSVSNKVVKVTAAVTAAACVVALCASSPILAVSLAVVGLFVMCVARISIDRSATRPRAARRKFLKIHHRNLQSCDTNEFLIGSSAWVIANDLTNAFQTSDHVSFTDSLRTFDDDAFTGNFPPDLNNNNAFSIIDHVHGGTDSSGMGGMTGHNDQGWGTDSHSSMSSSSFDSAHGSFDSSSSSHDPFA
jgi:hypothetical protein